jgi:diaminopimelate epimerase
VAGKAERVKVNMGEPILSGERIPTTLPGKPPLKVPLEVDGVTYEVSCISMGNPHCVIFVDAITDDMVHKVGPKIETHAAFPKRVNVEWIQVVSRTEAKMRVWERGSGETLACGTGACAAAVAGMLNNLFDRKMTMHLLGGQLELDWPANDEPVYMTGPAVEVFQGEWPGE